MLKKLFNKAPTDELVEAAGKGDLKKVKDLFNRHYGSLADTFSPIADCYVNRMDKNGERAITAAVKNGHTDVVELLLGSYAETHHRASDGTTLLATAIEKGDLGIVKLLLTKASWQDVTDNQGNTDLMQAEKSGNAAIIALFHQEAARRLRPNYNNDIYSGCCGW